MTEVDLWLMEVESQQKLGHTSFPFLVLKGKCHYSKPTRRKKHKPLCSTKSVFWISIDREKAIQGTLNVQGPFGVWARTVTTLCFTSKQVSEDHVKQQKEKTHISLKFKADTFPPSTLLWSPGFNKCLFPGLVLISMKIKYQFPQKHNTKKGGGN